MSRRSGQNGRGQDGQCTDAQPNVDVGIASPTGIGLISLVLCMFMPWVGGFTGWRIAEVESKGIPILYAVYLMPLAAAWGLMRLHQRKNHRLGAYTAALTPFLVLFGLALQFFLKTREVSSQVPIGVTVDAFTDLISGTIEFLGFGTYLGLFGAIFLLVRLHTTRPSAARWRLSWRSLAPSFSWRSRLLAALLSGALLNLVSPPVGWHWLHWFSFLPLYWALRPGSAKTNAKLGYAAGWIGVFMLFFWLGETVVRFSNLPWILSMITVVIFATAFAIPYAIVFGPVHWLRKRLGAAWIFVVPALQVTTEQLSPALFPYYHGVGQYQAAWVWQLASVTGVMGLSYLIFLTNSVLAEGMYRWQEGRSQPWRVYGVVALLFLGNLGFGAWRHGAIEAELAQSRTIDAALMQQNKTMEVRMAESRWESINSWAVLTDEVAKQKPDLVIWPEGSVHVNPNREDTKFKKLGGLSPRAYFEKMAKEGDFHLLVGGGTRKPVRLPNGKKAITAYNSAYNFSRDGILPQRYDKMIPLPFGEYIPFADTFPILREWIKGPGSFRPGEIATVFQGKDRQGQPFTYSVPICYEAILISQMWKMADVDLFVNITNDAWFGDTASPHQHAMLAAAMSTQFGRPMVRIAFSGISFVVDPHGDIRAVQPPFTDAVTTAPVHLMNIDTIYRQGGWLFSWLCVLGVFIAVIVARRRGDQSTEE